MRRQGDPLSAYLFIIAEAVLSQNLTQMVSRGWITPLSVQPGYDQGCHLFFADDISLFMRASALQLLLRKYQNASGQHFNIAKSHLFLGRMQPRSKKKISSLTGMSESKFPTTYLGVPLFQGAPKRRFFLRSRKTVPSLPKAYSLVPTHAEISPPTTPVFAMRVSKRGKWLEYILP